MLGKCYPDRNFVRHVRDTDMQTRLSNALDFYGCPAEDRSEIKDALYQVLEEQRESRSSTKQHTFIFTTPEQVKAIQHRFLELLRNNPHITVITHAVEKAVTEMLSGLLGEREVAFTTYTSDQRGDDFDPDHPLNAVIDDCQKHRSNRLPPSYSEPEIEIIEPPQVTVFREACAIFMRTHKDAIKHLLTYATSLGKEEILTEQFEAIEDIANGGSIEDTKFNSTTTIIILTKICVDYNLYGDSNFNVIPTDISDLGDAFRQLKKYLKTETAP